MKKLKKCPCCNGGAEFIEIKTKQKTLWQIACKCCDIASCIDDDRFFCLSQWNKRAHVHTLGSVIIGLTCLAPVLIVFGFFLGFMLGIKNS